MRGWPRVFIYWQDAWDQDGRGGLVRAPGVEIATLLTLPQVFLESVRLFLTQRSAELGAAVFDKDDALAVEFVTAAANLRAAVYGIPTQTLFAAKARLHRLDGSACSEPCAGPLEGCM